MRNKHAFDRGTIVAGTVPTPSGVRLLDQQASESLNGDGGGTWNPENPIVIGTDTANALAVSVDTYGTFTGGVSTGYAAAGLTLGDNDYPVFVTPRSYVFSIPVRDLFSRVENSFTTTKYDESIPGTTQMLVKDGSAGRLVMQVPSYRFPNGATIAQIDMSFRAGLKPTALPTNFLGFRLTRIPDTGLYTNAATNEMYKTPTWTATTVYQLGDAVQPTGGYNGWVFRLVARTGAFLSGGAQPAAFTAGTSLGTNITDNNLTWQPENAIGDGWILMPRGNMNQAPSAGFGTSFDQYYNNGRTQMLSMTPNRNTVIDTVNYNYAIEITDQSATNNYFSMVTFSLSNIVDMRPVA